MEAILKIRNGSAKLPDDFIKIKSCRFLKSGFVLKDASFASDYDSLNVHGYFYISNRDIIIRQKRQSIIRKIWSYLFPVVISLQYVDTSEFNFTNKHLFDLMSRKIENKQ